MLECSSKIYDMDQVMKEVFLPYSVPEIGKEELNQVTKVLESGWLTTGSETKKFEEDFSEFLGGTINSIAVNSATAGLHLALEALGITHGDKVIVPTFTFTATAEVVRYLGADPIFVDIDPITLNISPAKISSAITEKTKAIMPVHYGGLSCQMDEILSIAKQHDLKVVEDAAHALPSTWKKKVIGSLDSDATVFSFYANKTMTTGEGGMITSRHPDIIDRMKVMRLHGINSQAFDRFRSQNVQSWQYEIVAPGFKYNLTDLASAIGRVQLKKLPKFLKRREELASRYFSSLKNLPLILPARPPKGDLHAWHIYAIRLNEDALANGYTREKILTSLSKSGIGTSVHYTPLHRQPYWQS
ncbi:Spore coat polysaccharide biosynthesis protein SpsC, partial [Stylophora pistillata]